MDGDQPATKAAAERRRKKARGGGEEESPSVRSIGCVEQWSRAPLREVPTVYHRSVGRRAPLPPMCGRTAPWNQSVRFSALPRRRGGRQIDRRWQPSILLSFLSGRASLRKKKKPGTRKEKLKEFCLNFEKSLPPSKLSLLATPIMSECCSKGWIKGKPIGGTFYH